MHRLALHWQILIAMLVGAVVGILLNATASSYTMTEPVAVVGGRIHLYGMAHAVDVPAGTVWIKDSPNEILIQIQTESANGQSGPVRRVVVRGPVAASQAEEIASLEQQAWPAVGDGVTVVRREVPLVSKLEAEDPVAFALFHTVGRSTARTIGDLSKVGGDLFLRMLKMVSIPLIITSLIAGITSLGKAERLGKMFGRTLLYYMATSMLAICTGLLMVNLIQPGVSEQSEAVAEANAEKVSRPREAKGLPTVLFEQIENMIPPNPIQAAANGKFLSIIAFSILFAICTILVGGQTTHVVSQWFEAGFEVMMKMTMFVIHLAPLGVLLLMLAATATQGMAIFGSLGLYMITVTCALAFHALVVLPLIVKFVARRSPLEFARAMSPALLTAFSSASSNGTLPLTLTSVEQRAGISNRVGSFVLPLGATVNMDGTALYEVVAVLFIAQHSGIEIGLTQQVIVALTALLASIGAAGIPHAGLVMMVIMLQAVGLPTESQGLIIAVDRVLDMCRTSVNVWSDSCGCAVISRFESEGG